MRGATRTQFIAIDDNEEVFRKQHYDKRLGWHESTVSRRAVREDLSTRLTRSATQIRSPSNSLESSGCVDLLESLTRFHVELGISRGPYTSVFAVAPVGPP